MKLVVLGSGAWGTALATMLAGGSEVGSDHPVVLWGRDAQVIKEINRDHRNSTYLGDVALSPNLLATTELAQAAQADIVLCVTPAQTFGQIAEQLKPHLSSKASVVLCAKGIDRATGQLLHQLAADALGEEAVAALSGPSFATDVAKGLPTAVSLAAVSMQKATDLAAALSRPPFRIYATDDLVGVEIGGALKNVLALAVGIARGLQLGASAEAALIARGFAELSRVATAQGARSDTLAGLSGLGDLVLSCSSPQSRNFSYGMALAAGENLTNRPLAEGVHTAEMALKMAQQHSIEAPIIAAITQVLTGDVTPGEAVQMLLQRPLKGEV
ncbi:MAG: NAD(P)-dependent glycerol-3-phosphate dehydrogenase [Rhizobiaceae bacterium]|nr:NAD(P)-dependent glycerol-3-phosphate dehydrogenase [Hyphomicrobiales bacterium]NRB29542.1 NAD(P)-dependent glycerol-3-phosphate dehydrogenase [Rhizobiaceae bacterium]